jgi:hypothetical protein
LDDRQKADHGTLTGVEQVTLARGSRQAAVTFTTIIRPIDFSV